MEITKERIEEAFKNLQSEIISGLEGLDGLGKFKRDKWSREGGGGGMTCVMESGDFIEKGGVNFSSVFGALNAKVKAELKVEAELFYATGVSIVIHPNHPLIPIIHMNVRYFQLDDNRYWFGGGIDLTPHYIFEEDASSFHKSLKNTCDQFDIAYYTDFKTWADNYFYIEHRNETRGVGGIFFDRLKENKDKSKEDIFNFVIAIGKMFVPIYSEIVNRNRKKSFTNKEKEWQMLRRGRYVEFNLVYDRGTTFGLKTGGRIESILMSLPLNASWIYDFQAKEGSAEAQTLKLLVKGIDWIS